MRTIITMIFAILPFVALADDDRPVDVAIVTSFDRSESIDGDEAAAQTAGLIYALRHPRFHQAIAGGYYKRVALSALTWSSFGKYELILPWVEIGNAEQASTVALWLEKFLERHEPAAHGSQTDVAFGIEMAVQQMRVLPWRASKQVINIVGDGISNIGHLTSVDRDAALALGITVNGLIMARGSAIRVLSGYYRREVIGGPTAFLQVSLSNEDFAEAMLRKMTMEMVRLRTPIVLINKEAG